MVTVAILFLICFGFSEASHEALAGQQIWKVERSGGTVDPLPALSSLESDGSVDILGVESDAIEIRVLADQIELVSGRLAELGIPFSVVVEDLMVFLQSQEPKQRGASRAGTCVSGSCPQPFPDEYMTFAEIEYYLKHINVIHSDRVTVTSIGTTLEGRNIWMVNIKPVDLNSDKEMFIEAGIHAREWISPMVGLHLIHWLLEFPDVAKGFEFNIVPMTNPDGFHYSHTTDRMWRKNRATNGGSSCRGVDLNRNWDNHWGGEGSSDHRCSQIYKGTIAFSEPETFAVKEEAMKMSKLAFYLSLHSKGQLILTPHAWTENLPQDFDRLIAMAETMKRAIYRNSSMAYEPKTAYRLYVASGISQDWAYEQLKAPYSSTIELRDTGTYGFLLPADQIHGTSAEIWMAFQAATNRIRLLDRVNSRIVVQ